MQKKQWFIAAIAASVMLCSAARSVCARPPLTNQAFQVDVKLKASYEDPISGKLAKSPTITTASIINLALGRDAITLVPTNIVLAMIKNCSDDTAGYIAVVDTASNNTILTPLGSLDADGSAASSGKGVASLIASEWVSGNLTNAIVVNWLAFGGSHLMTNPESNACPLVSFKSKTATGIVAGRDSSLRNPLNPEGEFKVTITGGSLKTVKPIGYVSMP
jgi:hypothetical protein